MIVLPGPPSHISKASKPRRGIQKQGPIRSQRLPGAHTAPYNPCPVATAAAAASASLSRPHSVRCRSQSALQQASLQYLTTPQPPQRRPR